MFDFHKENRLRDVLTLRFIISNVAGFIFYFSCSMHYAFSASDDIQFNTDVMDIKDRKNIDLSLFAHAGYVMPGDYKLTLRINEAELSETNVSFFSPDDDPKGSAVCLTKEVIDKIGLKHSVLTKLNWWHGGQCLDIDSLKGTTIKTDLGSGSLDVSVPQAYLEYTADNWEPPSRWDNGVAGVIFDYDVNAMSNRTSGGGQKQNITGNGVSGANLGPWRIRADWQAQYGRYSHEEDSKITWDWSRYYVYRALTSIKAKLTLGENFLPSSMFDSFRFTGASLTTDDAQLPPNLRGYAPEIVGMAKTNAKITVSQEGRILYESTVSSGAFRIQDLNDGVSGKLDVKVEEQDGSVRSFQVDTATIPYLTRPGLIRYKLSAGKPSDYNHHTNGPEFSTGEFSWGINNGWSMYGGGIFGGYYNALGLGLGRDLSAFGAFSFDITESQAKLPMKGLTRGGSYRLSYSKRFNKYDSQITFAGYRFTERNFMNMSQFLAARYYNHIITVNGKEMYVISLNKQFRDLNMSAYLNYSHQTYWNRQPKDSWSGTFSRYFDFMNIKNLNLSISATRTLINEKNDDGLYIGMSIPWNNGASLSYNGQFGNSGSNNSISLYNKYSDRSSYNLAANTTSNGESGASAFITHDGDMVGMSANISYQNKKYRAVGFSLSGGATITAHGAALHRNSGSGGTRMMLDTGGESGVPIRGYGAMLKSNIFGKAVVSDISSYYRNSINIDLDSLPDDIEATRSVVQDTLTEGAIGYRSFGLVNGKKSMAVIKLVDGTSPPFGATITNSDNVQTGITVDDGSVWLTGIKPDITMSVNWDGHSQCLIHLPKILSRTGSQTLLLPCVRGQE